MEGIDGLEVGARAMGNPGSGTRATGNPDPGTRSWSLVVVVVVKLDIEISEEFKSGTEINDLLESSSNKQIRKLVS